MTYRFGLAALILLAGSTTPVWSEPTAAEQQLMAKLMQETKIVAVMGVARAHGFRADDDPDTLQVVYMTGPGAGPSDVSEDGEVIFLNDASEREEQALIAKAFEIRAKHRLAKQ